VDMKCRTCHAADGPGNPGIAKAMGVTLKPLSEDEVQKMADADIKKVINTGSGKMKPVMGLSAAQADDRRCVCASPKEITGSRPLRLPAGSGRRCNVIDNRRASATHEDGPVSVFTIFVVARLRRQRT
jgi:hypothetical protein